MCRGLIYSGLFALVIGLAITSAASAELIAWWKFDDGSGTTALDSSGNGHDGTLNGDAAWETGHLGGALRFDGAGDYVNCGLIDIDTAATGGLTVCAWINKASGGDMKFCSNRQGANAAGGGFTCTIYNDRMELDLTNAGARNLNRDTDGPTVPANTWVHVAWVYDDVANTFNEYHDGVLADSSTENVSIGISTQEFRIGTDAPSLGRYVNGLIDDLRIYDSALSEQELLGVMQGGGASYPFASRPSPADDALLEATWANLIWSAGDSATSHDLYFGTGLNDVNDGIEGTFVGNLTTTNQVIGFPGFPASGGLHPGTTYYWRVDEVNDADPNSPWKGDVWSFWVPPKKAYEPDPADGTNFVIPDATLSWTPGFGTTLQYVYFGDNLDEVSNASSGPPQTDATFTPDVIERGVTYYWRVDEFDGLATHKGDVWSFSTIPSIEIGDPSLVAWWMLDEGSGTTAVDYSGHEHHATIAGTCVFVTGYDGDALDFDGKNVYIDMDDRIAEGTFTCTMWLKPRDIPYSSGFYSILHDDVWNAGSCHVHLRNTTSEFNWSVNSGPNLSSTTIPVEDEWYHLAVAIDADAAGQGQLYVNGILEDTQPGGTGTPFLGPLNFGAWTNNQRYYHGLMDDIRVYDKVLTQGEILLVMRIDPLLAWQASPANGSTPDLDNATPLTWSAGDDASSHEVYFGADADAVANADTSDTTGVYSGSQNATSFTPAEGVEWGGGPYYWRIDENNSDGTVTTGRVWSFTVADFILVDDFEGYTDNDAANEAIWQYWIDGFGVPTNGSQVGNLMPPYAEQTIVHGGGQSMPLAYDNTAGVRNSEAVLTLAAPRDWTKHGVSALSLWVRGYPPSVGSFTEGPVGAFTMTAAGSDIWGTSDQFHFAYKTLTGPGTIVARVDSVQETHAWAKAGVMIRETLDADSKFAFMLVSAASGVAFQGRTDTGASAVGTTEADVAAPHWVRLERDVAGNFTASHSANGSAWAPVGTAVPLNIPMDGTVYVGLALTSHVAAATCEAKFSNVTITGNAGVQWVNRDVGILGNNAEPLYVSLSNTTGAAAVVVNDDPAAATIDTWTEWVIDLKAFSDQGVNLANVDRIAIGLGATGDAAAPGGTGTVFIDDIKLIRPVVEEPAGN